MPDLLLELFSEEIPARMQRQAAENLKKLVTDALVNGGLVYEGAKAFVTPRRLTLLLPVRDVKKRVPSQTLGSLGKSRSVMMCGKTSDSRCGFVDSMKRAPPKTSSPSAQSTYFASIVSN